MGKFPRRSRRRAERADALDFYLQLDEVERRAPRERRRRRRGDHADEPFGKQRRDRNRRDRDHGQPPAWEEAG